MKRLMWFAATAMVASLFTACGPDSGGEADVGSGTGDSGTVAPDTGDVGSGTLTEEQFAGALASEMCEFIFGCCPNGMMFIPDQATCETFVGGFTVEDLQRGAENGWLTFDGAAAGACLEELEDAFDDLGCDGVGDYELGQSTGSACGQAVQGHQAAGESCSIDIGEGTSTSTSFFCQPGLECIDDICQLRVPVGEACTILEFEDPCVDGAYCAEGTCEGRVELGGACASSESCADGLRCDAGACAEKLDEGEACTSYVECISDLCEDGVCGPGDGVCM